MYSRRTGSPFVIGLVLLATLLKTGAALSQELPAQMAAALNDFRIPVSAVSVDVRDMQTGKSILSLNNNVPRNPASVIKILTTLSALEMLGPNYQWETRYFADGKIRDGVLEGNLVIQGSGDPFLTVDRFWHQILTIRQLGIHSITGDLVLDNSLFDLPPHDRARFDDQPDRLYNVGPDAVLINFSASRFILQPIKGKISVYVDPPLSGMEIRNNLKPGDGKCSSKTAGWKYTIEHREDKTIATFNGAYRKRCGQYSIGRSLFSNHEYTWRLFSNLWESNGGQFVGGYRTGKVPKNAVALTVYPSEPLSDIVTSINKFSNNVMARQLMLTLDAQVLDQRATVEGARNRIDDWLTVNNLSLPGLYVDNGSGLSRETRITSGGLSKLLWHGWNSNYQAEFLSSLSLVALDGTMRKRLKKSRLRGRARIKTGLIKGVRSMAGYVNTRSGAKYSVVLMMESGAVTYWNGNVVQDALLEWLFDR